MERMLGSTPASDTPISPIEVPGKIVIVHYWEEFNTGKHLVFEQEVNEHTVQDLVLTMQGLILKTLGKKKDVGCLLVRFANKEGRPKIDMPLVQISQKVNNISFERFAICDKVLDEKARISLDESDSFSIKSISSVHEAKELQSQKWYKKLICCLGD